MSDIHLNPKEREARRLQAIKEIKAGYTQSEVASQLNASRTSVSNWVERFRVKGVDGLLSKPHGRPPARVA